RREERREEDGRRDPRAFRMRAWPSILVLSLATTASAEPGFARLFKGAYGYEPACGACHTEGGGSPLNGYGNDFKKAGLNAKGLAAIESLDSDGDGAANIAEIRAKANPGSRDSTPANQGNWLDPDHLIPAEVQ